MSKRKEASYHGNKNLKTIGYEHEFTPEQIREILKCREDPIYFIENYCHIVSLDGGLIPFKLYDCQKKKIEMMLGNRRVIIMEPRQNGKCLLYATRINIRNKKNNEAHSIRIGDFYEWQRFCRMFSNVYELQVEPLVV
jgi:hypothetical protein